MAKERETQDKDDRKMPAEERLRLGQMNKAEGNELFKGGTLEQAAQRYMKALGHMSKIFDAAPEIERQKCEVVVSCHLNMAQCYIKDGREASYRKAVVSCDKALEVDVHSVKALYRKAVALERLGDIDAAEKVLKAARQASPDDRDVTRLLDRVLKLQAQQQAKSRKVYAKMFS
eukprot:Filipodium_phascolosomae@DN5085_c0_g1_i1.p2